MRNNTQSDGSPPMYDLRQNFEHYPEADIFRPKNATFEAVDRTSSAVFVLIALFTTSVNRSSIIFHGNVTIRPIHYLRDMIFSVYVGLCTHLYYKYIHYDNWVRDIKASRLEVSPASRPNYVASATASFGSGLGLVHLGLVASNFFLHYVRRVMYLVTSS